MSHDASSNAPLVSAILLEKLPFANVMTTSCRVCLPEHCSYKDKQVYVIIAPNASDDQ